IVDKIERVLDFVCDPGSELTERSQLLSLHQAVLGGAQILQRGRQFARAGLDPFKQSHVLDRYRGLVGKGCDQLDLLVGKWPDLLARQNQDANWDALAQHRNREDSAEIAQSLRLHEGVFRNQPVRRGYEPPGLRAARARTPNLVRP